jgi:hypothetical protein
VRLSFIVNRPAVEPTFKVARTEVAGRTVNITMTTEY